MLSGQLAINQGAEPSGPLIAPGKKVVAEVERPSEREEVQGVYASREYLSHALFTLDLCVGRFLPIAPSNCSWTFARLDSPDT